MKRLTKAQIDADLMAGKKVSWLDGNGKTADLQLCEARTRRLYQFITRSTVREARDLPPDFVQGLWSAHSDAADPANGDEAHPPPMSIAKTTWRIKQLRTRNFGGINSWGGQDFIWNIDSKSWHLEGGNGSGKSSLLSAIVFAFTGKRPRDDRKVDADAKASVFGSDQRKVGTWPPLAAYPDALEDLEANPEVKAVVKLESDAGDVATIGHGLKEGNIVVHREGLPAFDDLFVSTGILMPMMLPSLRLGEGDEALTRAVEQLTGLDRLSEVGTLCAGLTHTSREYRSYAKRNNLDSLLRDFDAEVKAAADALAPLGVPVKNFAIVDAEKNDGPVVELGLRVKQEAARHASVLEGDLAEDLDLTDTVTQRRVAQAIGAASDQLALGLEAMATWKLTRALSDVFSPEASPQIEEAVLTAKTAIFDALAAHEKAQADARYAMKAHAATWHAQHSGTPIDSCPLCEEKFAEDSVLKRELEALRTAGPAAYRELRDNLLDASQKLTKGIPAYLANFVLGAVAERPNASLQAEIGRTLGKQSRHAALLRRFSSLAEDALAQTPRTELQETADLDVAPISEEHGDLLEKIARLNRAQALAEWHRNVSPAWSDWWNALAGTSPVDQDENNDRLENLSEHLERLTTSLDKAKPYATAATHLRKAVEGARKAIEIQMEQMRRDQVSEALLPLKSLTALAECAARQSIIDLSGRITRIAEGMHQAESFSFKSAGLDRKQGIHVRGSFVDAMSLDAKLVANTSWLRSTLWAFVFALREEAVEQHGFDPLPVWLFDDPQATFDGSHRLGWASHVASLQMEPTPAQVIIATHDESFHNKLKQANLIGNEALVVRAPRTACPLTLLDGSKLDQAWLRADTDRTQTNAQRHAHEVRVFLEGMLKAMLAGHVAASGEASVSALRDEIVRLANNRRAPWDRPSFSELAKKLSLPDLRCINQANHADRTDVEYADSKKLSQLWPGLLKQLRSCFRELRDWQLVHGTGAPFNLPESTHAFPEGFGHLLKAKSLPLLGRASAYSDGRVSEGTLVYEELDPEDNGVRLAKHSAFRLTASTLEPVARPGDILIVQEFGEPKPPALVVAVAADRLMARRFVLSQTASDVAVLTANAIDPYAIAPPLVANVATIKLRQVVGVIFDRPDPSDVIDSHEIVGCRGDAVIHELLSECRGLIAVRGQSAQPLALDGQFLLLGAKARSLSELGRLDGRPVIAEDSNQRHFFKRLRLVGGDLVILESLDGGGDYPPEVLWLEKDGVPGRRTLEVVWSVLGVLFERPGLGNH